VFYFSFSFRVKIVRLYSRLARSTILSRNNILRHSTASTVIVSVAINNRTLICDPLQNHTGWS